MNRKHFSALFRRYLNDKAAKEEINELMRLVQTGRYDEWIKSEIDRSLKDGALHSKGADSDMSGERVNELLQHILNTETKADGEENMRMEGTRRYPHSQYKTNWRWVAAAAVAIVSVFSWLYQDWENAGWPLAEEQAIIMQEVVTSRGERTSLILADGSRVILNADSRLNVPGDYGQHSRTLILNGEAFFDVEHDPTRPFRVYTGNQVYTEVLGTQFNIRSYEAAITGKVDVVVAEGRVWLGSEGDNQSNSVVVHAGQKGAIGPNGAISLADITGAGVDAHLGWIDGRLVFRDQTLKKMIRELERWYDVSITVTEPELLQRRMSAMFESDDSFLEVLQVISHALQINFTREKQHVQFSL